MDNNVFTKDPSAVLDFRWDWSAWLAINETITTSSITAPAGLTVDSQTHGTTDATAWISGGTDKADYIVTCHVTTNQNRQDDRSILIKVRDR